MRFVEELCKMRAFERNVDEITQKALAELRANTVVSVWCSGQLSWVDGGTT